MSLARSFSRSALVYKKLSIFSNRASKYLILSSNGCLSASNNYFCFSIIFSWILKYMSYCNHHLCQPFFFVKLHTRIQSFIFLLSIPLSLFYETQSNQPILFYPLIAFFSLLHFQLQIFLSHFPYSKFFKLHSIKTILHILMSWNGFH